MKAWIVAAALAVVATGVAVAQQDPIAERKALMRQQLQAIRATDGVVRGGGDPRQAVQHAETLVATTRRIPSLFPPGSERGETRSLPAIWSDRAGFERASADANATAQRLAQAASSGDRAALGEAYRAMGAACDGCHTPYRAPQR